MLAAVVEAAFALTPCADVLLWVFAWVVEAGRVSATAAMLLPSMGTARIVAAKSLRREVMFGGGSSIAQLGAAS
ncbi:hypothetical protein HK28_05960 [Acetobacter sp. DsW_063]|nr:hypothetical protein HK28_05960 [Acetobacter sp. DsW_063]